MKKHFSVVIAIVAIVCMICTFAACNNGGDEVDRDAVINDFVTLGLKKIDPNYKLNMSDSEIKALEEPSDYISAKRSLIFVADILGATSIRAQKLSKLNTVLWVESGDLFPNDENDSPDQTATNIFQVLSNGDLTAEDISDLLYTSLDYTLANGQAMILQMKADYQALKTSYTVADFENQATYDEVMSYLDEQILDVENTRKSFDEITAEKTNVSKTIKDAKEPLSKFFEAFAKVTLTLSSELSVSSGVEVVNNSTGDDYFNITAKPEELSAYVGSIKAGFQEVTDSFSDDDAKSVSEAMLTIISLFDQIEYPMFFINSVKPILSIGAVALNLYQPASSLIIDGLGAVDTAFAKSFIDIEKEGSTYVLENYAILYSKFIKAAIGDSTKAELKAKLDTYKAGLGNDTNTLKKHLLGLSYMGSFLSDLDDDPLMEEEDAKMIIGSLGMDYYCNVFSSQYYYYLSTKAGTQDRLDAEAQLEELTTNIYAIIKELTGSEFKSTKTVNSEEWFKEIMKKCDTTLDSVVNSSIDIMITYYKKQIDDILDNKLTDITELAEMTLQTETSDKYGRLIELEGKTGYGGNARNFLLDLFG